MGLFDSIKNVASSVANKVGDGVKDARRAVGDIAKKVHDAPAAVAKGAGQALEGAKELGRNFVKDPVGTIKSGAKQAVEGAKHIGRKVADGAKVAGEWAWKNKGEIGFWVGTTALMLAVPVSGGASGALAGGLMAARGAAIAAKVAQAGKAGETAVKVARAGAGAVQTARGAMGATKAGAAASRAGAAVHEGRVALGGTKAGKAMIAAQKPVTTAVTTVAGVHLADTSVKYARGDASRKDLALAGLAFAPAGIAATRLVAKARVARVNEKAAEVATTRLGRVADKAAGATEDASRVARAAPAANAPQTAGAAATARDEATGAVAKALELRQRASLTTHAGNADQAVSASRLADELDDVAERARSARAYAADAEELAPDAILTVTARDARRQLDEAVELAARTRRDIAGLAAKQQNTDRFVDSASTAEAQVGVLGNNVYAVNNGISASRERDGISMTDGSFARNLAWILLGRTQHAPAATVSR